MWEIGRNDTNIWMWDLTSDVPTISFSMDDWSDLINHDRLARDGLNDHERQAFLQDSHQKPQWTSKSGISIYWIDGNSWVQLPLVLLRTMLPGWLEKSRLEEASRKDNCLSPLSALTINHEKIVTLENNICIAFGSGYLIKKSVIATRQKPSDLHTECVYTM